ncbi:hypothetical protein C8R44DRAFT_879313 [Mycena epipterygia]|nr:hypothetical protein C8R44DRAFT_879313 [Mycena epipterygia]
MDNATGSPCTRAAFYASLLQDSLSDCRPPKQEAGLTRSSSPHRLLLLNSSYPPQQLTWPLPPPTYGQPHRKLNNPNPGLPHPARHTAPRSARHPSQAGPPRRRKPIIMRTRTRCTCQCTHPWAPSASYPLAPPHDIRDRDCEIEIMSVSTTGIMNGTGTGTRTTFPRTPRTRRSPGISSSGTIQENRK